MQIYYPLSPVLPTLLVKLSTEPIKLLSKNVHNKQMAVAVITLKLSLPFMIFRYLPQAAVNEIYLKTFLVKQKVVTN